MGRLERTRVDGLEIKVAGLDNGRLGKESCLAFDAYVIG